MIHITSTKTKIIITFGLGMTTSLIISMLLFPLAWQVMLLAIAGGVTVYALGNGWLWVARVQHQIKMMELEREQKSYMIVSHNDNLYNTNQGRLLVQATRLTSNKGKVIEGQFEPAKVQKNALDLINVGHHFLLIGDTDSGKTTLAKHFINHIGISNTIVCDPHAKHNNWPDNVKVAQRYDEIVKVIQATVKLMDNRYDKPGQYKLVLLVIDELPSIIDNAKSDVGPMIRRLSREGRKVDIRLLIMSQGENVGDLGQKGYSSMKYNFVKVLLTKQTTMQNYAKVVYANGDRDAISLLGPVNGCKVCGKATGKMYCSNACKQKAYRYRVTG